MDHMNSVGLEIVLMSIFMFIITFGFGHLPSKIPASKRIMNLISIFGAGLLVGAALIVVLPEGMLVIFKSLNKSGNDKEESASETDGSKESNEEEEIDPDINKYVGVSLIVGFAIMLIID